MISCPPCRHPLGQRWVCFFQTALLDVTSALHLHLHQLRFTQNTQEDPRAASCLSPHLLYTWLCPANLDHEEGGGEGRVQSRCPGTQPAS